MMNENRVKPENQRYPAGKTFAWGMQHVLTMYGGIIAPPLIIGSAAGLSAADIGLLITAALFVSGAATLLQSLGLPGLGARLPLVQGVSFASVSTLVGIAAGPGGLPVVAGAIIGASLFGLLIAPFFAHVIRFFPPLVTGTVITSIGLSLFPVAVNWAGGGQQATTFGSPIYLLVAGLVLAVILLINRFMRGFWVNVSVLVGMGLGYLLAGSIGMVDLSGLGATPWLQVVTPLHFGMPTFSLAPILSMCLVVVIIFVESTGMFLALGKVTDREVTPGMLRRGLLCDAGASFIAGFFNTFTHSSFAQNIGLVQMTGVRCRFVTVVAGGLLVVLSLLPKAAYLIASIPPAVLGGASIAMFGMVTATGIKILQEADIGDRRNQLLVAVSVGFGLIPVVRPEFFAQMPQWMEPITHSGIAMATVSALVLNVLFNILGGADRAAHNAPCHPH